MPRTCTVCTHHERAAIDQALVYGASLRDIAGQHGLSKCAAERHQTEHLPTLLTKAQAAEEAGVVERDHRRMIRTNERRRAEALQRVRKLAALMAQIQAKPAEEPRASLLARVLGRG